MFEQNLALPLNVLNKSLALPHKCWHKSLPSHP
jgi:hypothetical protein